MKESRRIRARGLTSSNQGATIFYDGRTYGVENVRYEGDATVVRFTGEVYILNYEEIEIWD